MLASPFRARYIIHEIEKNSVIDCLLKGLILPRIDDGVIYQEKNLQFLPKNSCFDNLVHNVQY